MSLPALPPEKKPASNIPSWRRVVIWVVVGAIGLYLVISGVVGIIAKGG